MAEGKGVTWQWLVVVNVIVWGSSQCRLAHGGHSRCETVVMKGGDGDGDGGGGKRGFVFVFGYEFCLVTSSSKDRLRPVRPLFCWSLNFQNHERLKRRPDHSCSLWWSLEFPVLGSLGPVQSQSFFSLGTGLPSITCLLHHLPLLCVIDKVLIQPGE